MESSIANKQDPGITAVTLYMKRQSKKKNQIDFVQQKGGSSFFIQRYHSNLQKGLTQRNAQQNRLTFGSNQYKKKQIQTFCQIFKQSFEDQMLRILIVAAIISIIVQGIYSDERDTFWLEGVCILAAVLVCSLVSTINNYQKQQQFQQLNNIEESTNIYNVLRQGRSQQIHRSLLVTGDIIFLQGGNQIPVDGLVLKSSQVVTNQGSITGEAAEKFKDVIQKCYLQKDNKDATSPILISGSNFTSGEATILALVVGKNSAAGKLNQMMFQDKNQDQQKTPLEIKLELLAQKIGKFGLVSAIIVFATLAIRLIIQEIIPKGFDTSLHIGMILKYLILSVAIVVVAVPQGLPLAVTLSLAFSVKKMLSQHCLVRKLASCETMGGAHFICTDKTGTLTMNQMFVVQLWNGNLHTKDNFKKFFLQKASSYYKQHIIASLSVNTNATLLPQPKGSSTQLALLKYCKDLNSSFDQSIKNLKQFLRIPFNSDRKRMSTGIICPFQFGQKKFLFQKGAVQIVIQSCSHYQSETGTIIPINKQQIEAIIQKMAKKGLRVLALAFKPLQNQFNLDSMQKDEKGVMEFQKYGYILDLLIGIQDLPRHQSKEAIQKCLSAGVRVIMVTGDNKTTARAIAEQVGIITPSQTQQGVVVEGRLIQKLSVQHSSREEILNFVQHLKVLARSQPQHKFILVSLLKKLNKVVAVTGDGTNDAPALVKADVGFSMGITGTQIAKSASDIIIMDDNFNSIVRALVWGRNIYDSIRKFLQFQLTVNITACVISVLSAAIIRQSILTAIQMLWVNMIMDSLASLALATQPPIGQELLKRRPISRKQPLITKTMIKHIVAQTIFQLTVLLVLIFQGHKFLPQYRDEFDKIIGSDLQAKYNDGIAEGTMKNGMYYNLIDTDNVDFSDYYAKYHVNSRHFTFIFTTFVLMQFFNFFNCRKIYDEFDIFSNITKNWLYIIIVCGILILQWIIVTFLNVFFKLYKFKGLTPQQWLISGLIAFIGIPLSFILRCFSCQQDKNNAKGDENSLFEKQPFQDEYDSQQQNKNNDKIQYNQKLSIISNSKK